MQNAEPGGGRYKAQYLWDVGGEKSQLVNIKALALNRCKEGWGVAGDKRVSELVLCTGHLVCLLCEAADRSDVKMRLLTLPFKLPLTIDLISLNVDDR